MLKSDFIKCPNCESSDFFRWGYVFIKNDNDELERKQKFKCLKCGHVWREK